MSVSKDPVHVRRRRLAAGALLGAVLLGGWGMAQVLGGDDSSAGQGESVAGPTEATAPQQGAAEGEGSGADDAGAEQEEPAADAESSEESSAEDTPAEDTTDPAGEEGEADQVWQREPAPAEHPSDTTALEQVDYLTGGLTPKSVMASGHGLMIANNMMYSHTSTVFDSTTREQVEVLEDGVDLAAFGIEGHPGVSQGSPVEAVWTEDGRYAYVSQYTMYGQNFGVEGFDACTRDSGVGPSFVYRFDAQEMAWDQVFQVGAVPKYLALSPDQRTLLVSNWCDATLSVVDTEKGEETGTVELAAAPRGLAIMPDNRTVYAVAMYADELYKVDLAEGTAEVVMQTPSRPRHLNLADEGRTLYLTTSGGNAILKMDTATDEVVDEAAPGAEPRSVALSPDEKALYVVNYDEASVSKIRTSDMEVIDTVGVDANPIGIDYDPVTHTVWVACYGGSIYVFDDQDSLL
ncbi:YncE family protein [uncultured Serinicoccus sp.]|uniref:YncE family protein n=1 Tax=uncultured Serinicoccus sp. TaxID=735514 RepID=UPI002635CE92|nr:YncE family protein [uncultured Serinicoccus sp.]